MTKEEMEYTHRKARTLETLKKCSSQGKSTLRSVHQPLLNIPIDHVVIDELHLLLRVFDVLLRNLLFMAIRLDQHQSTDQHLKALIGVIRSCGVTFDIWHETSGKKNNSDYVWTSLTGRDRKKVLKVCVFYF